MPDPRLGSTIPIGTPSDGDTVFSIDAGDTRRFLVDDLAGYIAPLAAAEAVGDVVASDEMTARLNDFATEINGGKSSLWLPGTSGNYVSCPDSTPLSITGDIEMVARVAADDWTPSTELQFLGKYTTGGNQRSYAFGLNTDGQLTARFSSDGATPSWGTTLSGVAPGFVDGESYWVKCTIDVDNGVSESTVRFYTADDDINEPTAWTQLGVDVDIATGGVAIFDGTGVLEVGSIAVGTIGNFVGLVHRAIVRNGIAGTLVADLRTDIPFTRYRDVKKNLWTLNGSASAFTPAVPS